MLLRPLAACALALPAAAQTAVDPPAFRWLETERSTGFPVGYPNRPVVRYQEVHDGLAGTPRAIAQIAFRRAPDDTAPAPAFEALVSMRLSTAATTAATLADRFADNEGPDAVLALAARTVSFPASGGAPAGLAPFAFVIPADRPFAFGGTGPLCVELAVASHTGTTPLAFALAAEDPAPRAAEFGHGCNGLALATAFDADAVAIHTVSGADPGAPVVLAFGLTAAALGGLPLPIDLSVIGAPGCTWAIDVLGALRGPADYFGELTVEVPLGSTPSGLLYFVQALSPVASRNLPPPPQLLRVSNAALVLDGSPRVAGRLWAEDLAAATGVRQPVYALVLEIR